MIRSLVSPPSATPVDLAMFKQHLRIDLSMTEEDALLEHYLKAAVRFCESLCDRAFVTQAWRVNCATFHTPIRLNYGAASLRRISYTAPNGAWKRLRASHCQVRPCVAGLEVLPPRGQSWPIVQRDNVNAVSIDYLAGFGVPNAVPDDIKTAVLIVGCEFYERRTKTEIGTVVAHHDTVEALLAPYRWNGF